MRTEMGLVDPPKTLRGETLRLLVDAYKPGDPLPPAGREIVLAMDGARVKKLRSEQGRSITLFKLKLTGGRRGYDQLRP